MRKIETIRIEEIKDTLSFRKRMALRMSEKCCGNETSEYSWWDGYWQALTDLQSWVESFSGD